MSYAFNIATMKRPRAISAPTSAPSTATILLVIQPHNSNGGAGIPGSNHAHQANTRPTSNPRRIKKAPMYRAFWEPKYAVNNPAIILPMLNTKRIMDTR